MTLCIAAIAKLENMHVIGVCSDWKASTDVGVSETSDKVRWIKRPRWISMMAGNSADCLGLVRAYRHYLEDKIITEDNAEELFRYPAQERLLTLKDGYVRSRLGISYSDLRKTGMTEFPESVLLEESIGIRKIDLNASLIIAGFVDPPGREKWPVPLIFTVDRRAGHRNRRRPISTPTQLSRRTALGGEGSEWLPVLP